MSAKHNHATPKAIFFDLDGTILDWQTGMEDTWLASIEQHNDGSYEPLKMQKLVRERREWFWNDPERAKTGRMDLTEACRVIVGHAFEDAGLTAVDIAHRIGEHYRAQRRELIAPYPGAMETIAAFHERGVRLALLTNGEAENQRGSVEKLRLESYFDCIVIEGELGFGKPDKRVFRIALEATGSTPETAWMVGDNLDADIAPAVELGLHAVWVDEAGDGLPADAPTRPDRIIRLISELL
ncbi:MAG: HAD family hydrolase [Chloroflexi bacterium]|nr:HAD family hydrolase [Chloroflexota bacterium]